MTTEAQQLLLLAGCWIAYFAIHSALASLAVKQRVARRWPTLMPAYRISYNVIALLLLIPIGMLSLSWEGPALWRWSGAAGWLADGLALLAVGGFVISSRAYDGSHFAGFRQLRTRSIEIEGDARLTISAFHRHVRHPWYSLALLLIWSRDMDAARLLDAIAISGYFVVGSILEERKLVVLFGEAYRRYMRAVPGLVPRPWRRLAASEARTLEQMAAVSGKTG